MKSMSFAEDEKNIDKKQKDQDESLLDPFDEFSDLDLG